MFVNSVIVFVLILFIDNNFFGSKCLGRNIFDHPQILAKYEDILPANTNHSLFCQGNQPLEWDVPEVEESQRSWTTFKMIAEKPTSSKFKYGLNLYITNISYPYVGFYYCHYKHADKHSEDESDKTYLYVNDSTHLSVYDYLYNISKPVLQYEVATIPCRPTSPDVQVQLTLTTGEVEDTEYNPKTGFSFFVYDFNQQNIYFCKFTYGEQEFETYFSLIVLPNFPVSHLEVPLLVDESDGHTIIGDKLILKCSIRTPNTVYFRWTIPRGINATGINTSEESTNDDTTVQTLVIDKTNSGDSGLYTCHVSDRQDNDNEVNQTIKIYRMNEGYIDISEPNGVNISQTYVGKEYIQWVVDVTGHPKPTVKWLDNANKTIPNGEGKKYEVTYNQKTKKSMLKIKNIEIMDRGTYTIIGQNNLTHKTQTFFLNVTDKPIVHMQVQPFYLLGTIGKVQCIAAAYPEPEFDWEFSPCPDDNCSYVEVGNMTKGPGLLFTSEVSIKATQSGVLKCTATNSNGSSEAVTGFYVSDVENGFDIFEFDETAVLDGRKEAATFAIGENIAMTCGASIYNYSNIDWLYKNRIIKSEGRYTLQNSNTQYSIRQNLQIQNAVSADTGMYACRVTLDGNYVYKNISINISSPMPPKIQETNMKSEETEKNLPDSLRLFCKVVGIPKPMIMWEKDSVPFLPSEKRIQMSDNHDEIIFNSTEPIDQGSYKCLAKNKVGVASAYTSIKFKNLPGSDTWLIIINVLLGALFIAAIIFIIVKMRREQHLRRELEKLGLTNFEKGAVENINPDLGLDDQVELLPYDKKWEFPFEQLKLGKLLGAGAFGLVKKAVAKHIVDGEDTTVVAVKMAKNEADITYIKALASELKIMLHLGKHLNVVNLLGACTKNVAKKELYVIVEYCRYGNLQNYLLRHRGNFINQVDIKTGRIDYSLGQEYFNRSFSVSSSHIAKSPTRTPPDSMADYRVNAENTENTQDCDNSDMTTTTNGENGIILSNNSTQPEWRSNYKGDYKGNVKAISTKDLMAWSFQVARGMHYLASRKVLHGDLAARNILLSDNDVVKICDFGLAKSMYKNDNYKKRGNCPLPVKWMPIESISDKVFSTQSDVWSFGIVLWEFFSLGKTPYPGIEADERLYHKLVEGYRMESPKFAPRAVYEMMKECWHSRPMSRPTFEQLTERLGNQLEDSLRQHYIDLNDPYLVMNTRNFEENPNDYLAMVSPPTFEALSSPLYENDDQGYMSMNKQADIFSPRLTTEAVFDFNPNSRKHLNSENDANGTELLPMLHSHYESDNETPLQSPNSIANPTYHQMPTLGEDLSDSGKIVKSADNYVNMPQNKHIIKDKADRSNNVHVNNTKPEPHYVNSNSRDWEMMRV